VDPLLLRQAMGHFTTGVAIVTTYTDGVAHGMTVNSLTSVALNPPLVLVCLTTGARTTSAVESSGRFAINILSARQERLAARFARRGEAHFDGLPLAFGTLGVPMVPDALAQLECAVDNAVPAGDHLVVIGRVLRAEFRAGEPLAFFGGRFCAVAREGDERGVWFR
jgi:flavin reductase (DIM6/NTAB) family NADH-FMN oxidoreductase RutF